MTRAEAEGRAARLNAEHAQRETHHWRARAAGEDWQVVRVAIPGGVRLDPLHEAVESRPRPQPPEDPRPLYSKNVGGPWVG